MLKKETNGRSEIEIKKAENQLNSNDIYKKILNDLDAIVYIADMKTYELIFVNRKAKELFGAEIGQKCYSKMQNGKTEPCSFCTNKILNEENLDKFYIWEDFDKKNGCWYERRDQIIKWSDGRIVRLEIAYDITEKKQKAKKLKDALVDLESSKKFANSTTVESNKNTQLLKNIINLTPDWVFVKDTNFRYILVNDSYANMMGKTEADFIGKDDIEMGFPPELVFGNPDKNIVGFRVDDATVLGGQKIHNPHDPAPDANGDLHIFDTHKIPVRDSNNKIFASLGFAHDVTERERSEEKIKKILIELKNSNKQLEQFAYVASHDLKEPLRMVSSFVQLLEKRYKGKLDEKADKYINYAVDGALRMQRLIDDLLSYSRINNNNIDFKLIDTNKILKNVILSISKLIDVNSAQITFDNLPKIIGDETQIGRLFQNLLTNAIKFKREEVDPKVHISVKKENSNYIFSVKDNGIGIDNEYKEKIFVIFQRLHGKGEYEGTGIGLSVVKRILSLHNGKIWFDSEIGDGTTFYFSIPYKKEQLYRLEQNKENLC